MICKDCKYPINYDNFMACVNGYCDDCIVYHNICEYCKVFEVSDDPERAEQMLCNGCFEKINQPDDIIGYRIDE